ncbi:Transposon Ty3-G Gag-Pol polyprotein (Gag3-Pol3) (Transposon Ty3-1 TYA-TYB polyprotein) [Cleaved into: Capsid protein (CA) (p24), partial [Durusdinium trenchii]
MSSGAELLDEHQQAKTPTVGGRARRKQSMSTKRLKQRQKERVARDTIVGAAGLFGPKLSQYTLDKKFLEVILKHYVPTVREFEEVEEDPGTSFDDWCMAAGIVLAFDPGSELAAEAIAEYTSAGLDSNLLEHGVEPTVVLRATRLAVGTELGPGIPRSDPPPEADPLDIDPLAQGGQHVTRRRGGACEDEDDDDDDAVWGEEEETRGSPLPPGRPSLVQDHRMSEDAPAKPVTPEEELMQWSAEERQHLADVKRVDQLDRDVLDGIPEAQDHQAVTSLHLLGLPDLPVLGSVTNVVAVKTWWRNTVAALELRAQTFASRRVWMPPPALWLRITPAARQVLSPGDTPLSDVAVMRELLRKLRYDPSRQGQLSVYLRKLMPKAPRTDRSDDAVRVTLHAIAEAGRYANVDLTRSVHKRLVITMWKQTIKVPALQDFFEQHEQEYGKALDIGQYSAQLETLGRAVDMVNATRPRQQTGRRRPELEARSTFDLALLDVAIEIIVVASQSTGNASSAMSKGILRGIVIAEAEDLMHQVEGEYVLDEELEGADEGYALESQSGDGEEVEAWDEDEQQDDPGAESRGDRPKQAYLFLPDEDIWASQGVAEDLLLDSGSDVNLVGAPTLQRLERASGKRLARARLRLPVRLQSFWGARRHTDCTVRYKVLLTTVLETQAGILVCHRVPFLVVPVSTDCLILGAFLQHHLGFKSPTDQLDGANATVLPDSHLGQAQGGVHEVDCSKWHGLRQQRSREQVLRIELRSHPAHLRAEPQLDLARLVPEVRVTFDLDEDGGPWVHPQVEETARVARVSLDVTAQHTANVVELAPAPVPEAVDDRVGFDQDEDPPVRREPADLVAAAARRGVNEQSISERERQRLVERAHALGVAFREVFIDEGPSAPAAAGLPPYEIELADDTPVRAAARGYSPVHRQVLREFIDEMLAKDVIEPNPNPVWSSPTLLTRKPSGGWRVVFDLSRVNRQTRSLHFPGLHIYTELARLKGSRVFATLDVGSAFWRLQAGPRTQEVHTFSTPFGAFKSKRLLQGSLASAQHWQTCFQIVLQGLEDLVWAYMDDVLVHAPDNDALLDRFEQVLGRLRRHRLSLKPEKLRLLCPEVEFIGHLVTKDGLRPTLDRVKTIEDLPSPTTADELSTLIGMLSWVSGNIPHFEKVMRPLQEAKQRAIAAAGNSQARAKMRKVQLERDIGYGRREREAEALAKRALRDSISIAFLDPDKQLALFTDAQPNSKPVRDRLTRWACALSRFDYIIRHISSAENAFADVVSRIERPLRRDQNAAQVEEAGPDATESGKLAVTTRICATRARRRRPQLTEETAKVAHRVFQDTGFPIPDKDVVADAQQEAIQAGGDTGCTTPIWEARTVRDGLVFVGDAVWIPPAATELQVALVLLAHTGLAGHRGVDQTLAMLKAVHWPGKRAMVARMVRGCVHCFPARLPRRMRPRLSPLRHGTHSNELVWVDILHESQAKTQADGRAPRMRLIMRDDLSSYTRIMSLETRSGPEVARVLFDAWIRIFGPSQVLGSDMGAELLSDVMEQLLSVFQITREIGVAHAPQTHAVIERANRAVNELTRVLASELRLRADDWPQLDGMVELAINSTPSKSLGGLTPLEVFAALPPLKPVAALFGPEPTQVQRQRLDSEEIRAHVERVQDAQAARYEQACHHRMRERERSRTKANGARLATLPELRIGTLVWVRVPAGSSAEIKLPKAKLAWHGPFELLRARRHQGSRPRESGEDVAQGLGHSFDVRDCLTGDIVEGVHLDRLCEFDPRRIRLDRRLKDQMLHDSAGTRIVRVKDDRVRPDLRAGLDYFELKVEYNGRKQDHQWMDLFEVYTLVPEKVRAYLFSKHRVKRKIPSQMRELLELGEPHGQR